LTTDLCFGCGLSVSAIEIVSGDAHGMPIAATSAPEIY
jgi:hypothetical protein